MPTIEPKPSTQYKSKPREIEKDEALVKAQADLKAKELAKKEARKRRREARKGKAKS